MSKRQEDLARAAYMKELALTVLDKMEKAGRATEADFVAFMDSILQLGQEAGLAPRDDELRAIIEEDFKNALH